MGWAVRAVLATQAPVSCGTTNPAYSLGMLGSSGVREEKGQDMRLGRALQPLMEHLGEEGRISGCGDKEGEDKDGGREVEPLKDAGGAWTLLPWEAWEGVLR